jgi:hypothetical protein
MYRLTLDPYVPLALWFPLALAAAGLLVAYAMAARRRLPRRRRVVVALMSLAVAVPLAILLNPTWLERIPPPPGKPLVTILVDRSASMATPDEGGAPRFEAACRAASTAATKLADRYEVRLVAFAGDSARVAPDRLAAQAADGGSTDLAAAIEDALGEERPQGQAMLLLSDGGHNAGGGAARLVEAVGKAKAMAVPVYTRTYGGQTGVSDLAVELAMPQELAFVGQKVPVPVRLRQRGALGRRTRVAIAENGKTIETRDVELKPDDVVETVFYVAQPAAGLFRYEIKADPLPKEITDLNNTAALLLRVVDQPVRVLLLEGKPYWDTKFLIRTLSQDSSIALDSVVQLTDSRLLERKASSPRSPAKAVPAGEDPPKRVEQWKIRNDARQLLADADVLSSYQIIVLGRDAEVFLSEQAVARLEKWLIEHEGSLVCFRGAPASQISQRLRRLMPVRWAPSRETRFRIDWTPVGQSLRWLPSIEPGGSIKDLPSLAAASRVESAAPLGVVLATTAEKGGAQPVLSYQPVGGGRVVVLEGAGMWRWAFLPPQYQQHDDAYGAMWRSLIRWLVSNVGLLPSEKLALRTDKVTFSTAEAVTATLLLRPEAAKAEVPRIELTGEALGQPRDVVPLPSGADPGQFRVVFGKLPEGRYTVRAAKDAEAVTAQFDVRGNLAERLDVQAQPNLMRLVAEKSGGAVLDRADPGTIAEQFERHLAETRPDRFARASAWDRWWILLAAMALWACCWGLRRWSGLV